MGKEFQCIKNLGTLEIYTDLENEMLPLVEIGINGHVTGEAVYLNLNQCQELVDILQQHIKNQQTKIKN